MRNFEEKWLTYADSCPSIRYIYVDDTLSFLDSETTATRFVHYLNTRHPNVNFKIDRDENYANYVHFLSRHKGHCSSKSETTEILEACKTQNSVTIRHTDIGILHFSRFAKSKSQIFGCLTGNSKII